MINLRDTPAAYTNTILAKLAELAQNIDGPILDPFAGVGNIHKIGRDDTWGIELEPEWAGHHPRTLVGDATALPFKSASFGAIITSPSYGNRLADSYSGEMCKACIGYGKHLIRWDMEGSAPAPLYTNEPCPACKGSRHKPSRRFTYRLSLGRELSPNSGASLHWGSAYRSLHGDAVREFHRVIRPGGVFVLNIKDHIRKGKRQHVMNWWIGEAQRRGFAYEEAFSVDTPGIGLGQNWELRVDGEQVVVFRRL